MMKLDSWEREPLWLKVITPYLKKKRFPKLTGSPETKKWYRIYADDCIAANGDPIYADFQLGTENKLLIFFQGGGVSWNEYTAARPSSLYQKNIEDTYYMIQVDLFSDLSLKNGIFVDDMKNPFNNWSKLVIPYCTGDFHCGSGDFPYIAQDGSKRFCHHHGYINFSKVMESVTKMILSPSSLFVSGCSGGGFGAALMSDTIIKHYPNCEDVTCLVDSGFFPMDGWHEIARDVWHAPKEILNRIHTDNITMDALQALYNEHNGKVRILLSSSNKDSGLARMINMVKNGSFSFSEESGTQLKEWLKIMMEEVQKTIPNVGIYLFDIPDPGKKQKSMNLTRHCIIGEKDMYEHETEDVTCAEWINNALNGKIERIGLNLLK